MARCLRHQLAGAWVKGDLLHSGHNAAHSRANGFHHGIAIVCITTAAHFVEFQAFHDGEPPYELWVRRCGTECAFECVASKWKPLGPLSGGCREERRAI